MSSSIAQKVDTQARVIRSLNLIHCADTRHMVGAVELERLLNLEVENLELKRRIQRLEELGNKPRECASQLGWTSSDDSRWIERAEAAVKAWDKEAKP